MSLFIIVNVGATLSLLAPSPLELPAPLGAAVSGYGAALVAHPLATKGATALALSVSGDAVTQVASREPERGDSEARGEWFDARRNLGFGAFGGAYGLVQGALFDVLNESPAVPALYFPLFFAVVAAVRGYPPSEAVEYARAQIRPLLLRCWSFFLPLQLSNFVLVTYVSLGSFVWTCILSYASSPPPAATARGAAAECEPVMEVCEVPLEPPPGGLSTDDLLVRRRARRGAE
ncbi:hypothetical protein EMIHUDRAFT_115540 [Emiliania huxleyi CCMP1516]|uniref:Uncharacterized protein n=2 Tax=Emiliania huxleyi TaxID=2903 RepID=A0A0D3JPJ4_EMIH1|nr:hypothetical protein EMIHUDRAFT_115540 [Emiliania huxleyi CCMP1516]EOD25429.1 hypothetical protein EMIHUDRAFT_115540 [Emiliania huxleyi CCMP1516]|eukprot:XP_005777858.1 hypothetical protein EMIHUDRAFT_115540 [Emiliania huxleyi CCMP1516]